MAKEVVLLSKEFDFDSAHHLDGYRGKCANLHGHTWKFTVTIGGEINPKTGMLVDFGTVDSFVKAIVIDRLDHKYLNHVLSGINPTAENLAVWIYDHILEWLMEEYKDSGIYLHSIKLWEKYPSSYVEYFGEAYDEYNKR